MKYKIQKELYKKGNYYTAFEAVQEGLGKKVEIRVFNQKVSDPTGELVRFQLEIQTLAFLDHPFILRILDCGVGNEKLYYVTDLKNGRSLADLKKTPGFVIETDDVMTLALDLAGAIKYMHSKGVIHRGIALDTVNFDPENRTAYVADFSFAKNLKIDGLTARGIGHVLPELSTPENLIGRKVDERTDIYLLGTLLFNLLTGSDPYPPKVLLGLNEAKLREIKPREMADLAPDLPLSLEEVVLRAIQLHPDDRYNSDTDLIEALKNARKQLKLPRSRKEKSEVSENSGTMKRPARSKEVEAIPPAEEVPTPRATTAAGRGRARAGAAGSAGAPAAAPATPTSAPGAGPGGSKLGGLQEKLAQLGPKFAALGPLLNHPKRNLMIGAFVCLLLSCILSVFLLSE